MDKKEIYKKLNDNIQEMDAVEIEISMIELAIYEKSLQKLKEEKIKELEKFLREQASYYNQNSKEYENSIIECISNFKSQLEKTINVYDSLYANVFRLMQEAMSNQKIAVANIVTIEEKIDSASSEEELRILKNTAIACAQKKLNYEVIIAECRARLKWCYQDAIENINKIFVSSNTELQIYENSFFGKIKLFFTNKLFGNKRYSEFLNKYKNNKEIVSKNNYLILEIAAVIKGVLKQVEDVKKQIAVQYQKALCVK